MPNAVEALPCGSRSTISTRRPARARAAATFTAVVVLPTPPFWLAMVSTRVTGDPPSANQGPMDGPVPWPTARSMFPVKHPPASPGRRVGVRRLWTRASLCRSTSGGDHGGRRFHHTLPDHEHPRVHQTMGLDLVAVPG